MKKCKNSADYDGKNRPPCHLHKTGPCEACVRKHQDACTHPLSELKMDGLVRCRRCGVQFSVNPEHRFLWEKLMEANQRIQELEWDMDSIHADPLS